MLFIWSLLFRRTQALSRPTGLALCLGLGIIVPGCRRQAAPLPSAPVVRPTAAVPSPPPTLAPLPAGGIKGIYLTGWTAGQQKRFNELVSMIEQTELNAVVIDIKDNGLVSYDVEVPLVKQAQASRRMMRVGRVMTTLAAPQ